MTTRDHSVTISAGRAVLSGDLVVPKAAGGIVLFAHGSGSSRKSPRNRYVAEVLQEAGLATLLMDLLTREEERADLAGANYRFDIDELARRLVAATDWVTTQTEIAALPVGYFGASTGAGAALVAATQRPTLVRAVVSRGGRPDLAEAALGRVQAPTLLIVGGADDVVIDLNRKALARMRSEVRLEIVPGATHLFEEPGTLHTVAALARAWFERHLRHRVAAAEEAVMDPNAFYRIVKQTMGEESRERVTAATAAVLHALRDRLTPEEALQARAQLPTMLKERWDEGDDVDRRPLRQDRRAFYARVQREAALGSEREARWATLGVFAALKEQLTPGEAEDVMAQLPKDLKETWAEAQPAA